MTNRINADIFPRRLRLKPGRSLATFTVTVINESSQFAAFQLELLAPGYTTDQNRKWYSTEPRVSAKKPPGDRTVFSVSILEAPIPGFVGRLELIVRVFSLEFQDEARRPISIDIEPGESYLILELPAPRLQVYPRNLIQIPVRVYNPRREVSDVSLNLLGVDSTWLPEGAYQRLVMPAGQQAMVHFLCQPPNPALAPCADYPFTVEAMPSDGLLTTADGILEMLPAGFIEFSCDRKQQQIPKKRKFFITWKSEPVTYKLQLENTSNLWQEIELKLEGQDLKGCKTDLVPDNLILDPAEKSDVDLVVHKKRPWLGLARRLLLEAEIHLKDTTNINSQVVPNPKAQLLELKVLPIIPPWLQAAAALLLLLLLWLWLNQTPPRHLDPVTTVQLSGDAGTVMSGSRDQTIRRWRVNEDKLDYAGKLADTGKAVRVIRYRPLLNNVVAAGLENGEIQFWDILSSKNLRTLSYFKDDRVFGLDFTQDSHYIYSGHGSGRVLEWNLEVGKTKPTRQIYVNFAVYAIALSENIDERILIISGRYNQLALWDLRSNRVYQVKYQHLAPEATPDAAGESQNSYVTPISGQNNYIESIATTGSTLATADNQGYITLWNLAERSCLGSAAKLKGKSQAKGQNKSNDKNCEIPILNQWNNGHQGKPVRSVALTSNGCYLASTGDDGRVMLWPLTTSGKRIPENSENETARREIVVDSLDTRLNSVDVMILQNNILVTNDDYDNRIRFNRLSEKGLNPYCQ
jgi:WD40 repeat protein